jgi:superfamily II DNA/RNA helicase
MQSEKKTYNDAGEPSEEKGEEHCIQPVYFLRRSSGDPLHSELQKGIKFLWFDGKLSQKHKEKVLKEFSESQDKLVCLSNL